MGIEAGLDGLIGQLERKAQTFLIFALPNADRTHKDWPGIAVHLKQTTHAESPASDEFLAQRMLGWFPLTSLHLSGEPRIRTAPREPSVPAGPLEPAAGHVINWSF